jgi:hypothetical protein
VALAHCMLDTRDYKHTLRICNNNYFFSTATVVARKSLNVTLRIACIASVFLNLRGSCWDVTSDLICTTFFRFCSNSVGMVTNNILQSRVAPADERCNPMTCRCRHTVEAEVGLHSIRCLGTRRGCVVSTKALSL